MKAREKRARRQRRLRNRRARKMIVAGMVRRVAEHFVVPAIFPGHDGSAVGSRLYPTESAT